MAESIKQQCVECGAPLAPNRRYCLACQAPVAGATRQAEKRLEFVSQIASTQRPDKTIVFVPELKEARLQREKRNRRVLIAAALSCVVLVLLSFVYWRAQQRKQVQVRLQRRETLARNELDRYAKALETFRADANRYPSKLEGLNALLKQPSTIANWRGPYIEGDYSLDPWGNEYVYRVYNDGAAYELFTNGPEGEAAGKPFLQVNSGGVRTNDGAKP
ncbi:MAG: type II secretion system protein GspG [Acidobacteria bacterium]|nr:type II secretion system protein GspG [Acidobacteriota bacterium]MBI3423669.1 type II secretion system protein GspG [Acidobacteriota bacterium]